MGNTSPGTSRSAAPISAEAVSVGLSRSTLFTTVTTGVEDPRRARAM